MTTRTLVKEVRQDVVHSADSWAEFKRGSLSAIPDRNAG
jgi:hypothetical protein